MIGRSFSIVRLQADQAWEAKSDVVISPQVREFAWDDFVKTPQLVAAGEEAARRHCREFTRRWKRLGERVTAEDTRAVVTGSTFREPWPGRFRTCTALRAAFTASREPFAQGLREASGVDAETGFEQAFGSGKRVIEFG